MPQPLVACRLTLLVALCGVLPLWGGHAANQELAQQEPAKHDPDRQDPPAGQSRQDPPQDPPQDRSPELRNPQPPADAMPLAPVPEGLKSAVERRDLAKDFLPPTPLEGVWRLTRISQSSGDLGRVEGYLTAGRRHLQFNLLHGQPGGGRLFVQSAARLYTLQDGVLVTQALLGYDTLVDGKTLRFDTPGRVERRQVEIAGSRLTIRQGEQTSMEFIRVE